MRVDEWWVKFARLYSLGPVACTAVSFWKGAEPGMDACADASRAGADTRLLPSSA